MPISVPGDSFWKTFNVRGRFGVGKLKELARILKNFLLRKAQARMARMSFLCDVKGGGNEWAMCVEAKKDIYVA